MSILSASKIQFRSAIGAATIKYNSGIRVYTQDVHGNIIESCQDGGNWTTGATVAKTVPGSPIAAACNGATELRVYYLSADNLLQEAAYSGRWYAGDLNARNFAVAPYSKIAATYLGGSSALVSRVYVQSPDNTIQEYCYDNGSTGWVKGSNLGPALPGTHIATTSWAGPSIRTYFQDMSLNLVEHAYDSGRGWYTGDFSVPNAIPRAPIAVGHWGNISLRVYYGTAGDSIQEMCWDGSWYAGGFKASTIPGSLVAAVSWDGPHIRVYLANGTYVTAISEWSWNGGWSLTTQALPPA